MSFLGLVRTHWQGTTGGPGLTQLAVRRASDGYITPGDAQTAVNAVASFWQAVKAYIPNEVTLTVDPVVDTYYYDGLNNDLETSASAATAPAAIACTGANAYNMAAGLRINLNTGKIRYGRRINGSIFLVPADAAAYTLTGTINPTAKTTIDTAGGNLLTGLTNGGLVLGVWSRWNEKKHPERPSAFSDVQTIKTNDKSAVLRGRRD